MLHTPLRIEVHVTGGYYEITGEFGHSEKNLTKSFYRLLKFNLKIPCSCQRIPSSQMLNEHPG